MIEEREKGEVGRESVYGKKKKKNKKRKDGRKTRDDREREKKKKKTESCQSLEYTSRHARGTDAEWDRSHAGVIHTLQPC